MGKPDLALPSPEGRRPGEHRRAHQMLNEDQRARSVWLLSIDAANEAAQGADFVKVYAMPARRGRGSTEEVSMQRRMALALATTVGDVPARALAKAAGVHWTTVAHHVAKVADLRDESPRFDQLMEDLQRRVIFGAASVVIAALGNDRKAVEGLG